MSIDPADRDNNIIVTGAVMALLQPGLGTLTSILTSIKSVTDADGQPTNQLDIVLSFMKSPYRLTIERVEL